ncbi:hypothetical protein LguiA_029838 [Lonicera macranthoides]
MLANPVCIKAFICSNCSLMNSLLSSTSPELALRRRLKGPGTSAPASSAPSSSSSIGGGAIVEELGRFLN